MRRTERICDVCELRIDGEYVHVTHAIYIDESEGSTRIPASQEYDLHEACALEKGLVSLDALEELKLISERRSR